MRALALGESLSLGEAERGDIRLPDGTTVVLAPGTRLRTFAADAALRFRCALDQGEIEADVAPGKPIRVQVPGGSVETLGTRFCVRVKQRPDGPASAATCLEVLQGRVRVDHGLMAAAEVAAGESVRLNVFREQGELVGRALAGRQARDHFILGPLVGWRIETRDLGEVWVYSRGQEPDAAPGAWVRVRFEQREGLLVAGSVAAMPEVPAAHDCAEDPAGPRARHAACVENYRVLASSDSPRRLIDAAVALVRLGDPLADVRIVRAIARLAHRDPETAEALQRCRTQLPGVAVIETPEGRERTERKEP